MTTGPVNITFGKAGDKPEHCATCGHVLGIARYPRGGRKYCSKDCRDAAPVPCERCGNLVEQKGTLKIGDQDFEVTPMCGCPMSYDAPDVSPVTDAERADLHGLLAHADNAAPFPWPKPKDGAAVADGIAELIQAGRWR